MSKYNKSKTKKFYCNREHYDNFCAVLEKKCPECGEYFKPHNKKQIFCSNKCRAQNDLKNGINHYRQKGKYTCQAIALLEILENFKVSFGIDYVPEKHLGRFWGDAWWEDLNVVFESNGMNWHGFSNCEELNREKRKRDKSKRKFYADQGYNLFEIWGWEYGKLWKKSSEKDPFDNDEDYGIGYVVDKIMSLYELSLP